MANGSALELIEERERNNRGPAVVPIARIERLDGSHIAYDLSYAIRDLSPSERFKETHDRLWIGGALMTIGDALAQVRYLDDGPDLHFLRHLRNGVAHGNRFDIRGTEPKQPAHFTGPDQKLTVGVKLPSPRGDAHTFRITKELHGGGCCSSTSARAMSSTCSNVISWRLDRLANGDEPSDLYPQKNPNA